MGRGKGEDCALQFIVEIFPIVVECRKIDLFVHVKTI